MMAEKKETGLTKSVGYEFGLRKTFDLPVEAAWDLLFSAKGLQAWLGKTGQALEAGLEYKTTDGTEGKVRVWKPYSHIRLSWKPKGWANNTLLQIRTIDAKGKCTVSFHHEKLDSAQQRADMKLHWEQAMERIAQLLA